MRASTGQGAQRTTASATLPRTTRWTPRRRRRACATETSTVVLYPGDQVTDGARVEPR